MNRHVRHPDERARDQADPRGPIRIAIVCHSTLGGSARSAARLATGLARRGHHVHLISRASLPWPVHRMVVHHRLDMESATLEDPSHARWPPALSRRFEALVRQVIEDNAIDVLHYHYAVPFADLGARVASALGRRIAVVGTLHGTDVTGDTTEALRAALAGAVTLTTVSKAYAAHARAVFQLRAEPQVIHNFVSADEHQPAPLSREQHRERLRKPRLIHVSNYRAVKSTGSLARIFTRVRQRLDAELWLVGDGPELPALRAALDARSPEGSVQYLGMRQDVAPLLAGADLMVLTSREESFGLVALEAMACGVPVLAPRVGGIPEVVTDGVAGILFRGGDDEHGASCALEVLSDTERHWALRQGALARARDFSETRIIAEYEALYRRLQPRHGLPVPATAHAASPWRPAP